MATTTTTTLDAILKTQYLPVVREQFNNFNPLLSRLEKDYDSVQGKNFTMALHTGRNESVSNRAEGGTLPTADQQKYANCIVPMKYMYGRIELTGPTMRATRGDEGSYIRALESEMKGLTTDFKNAMNRQMWGDGTGAIATIPGALSAATTAVVDDTRNLRIGMRVDVYSGATASSLNNLITGITQSTRTVTFQTAVTSSANATIHIEGSKDLEIMGLTGIFSDTRALQGITPNDTTNWYWKANVMTNATNRAISEILLQTAIDNTRINSDGEVTALYSSFGVRRAYQALLSSMKQYTTPTSLKGGWTALDYNGMPFMCDPDCPSNKIFCVDESKLKMYRMSDLDWMDKDGAVLSRCANKDAYEATLFIYHELGTGMRNAMTLIDKITES